MNRSAPSPPLKNGVRTRLDAALAPLTVALTNLRACAREHRAFVIVEDTVTRRFVQFSGSNQDPLWFDAPMLGIVNSGPKFAEPSEAAAYGLAALSGPLDLPGCAELVIAFESTGPDGGFS